MIADIVAVHLNVVFVGTSKSTMSAKGGHYYPNPSNMFWNLLEATGLTEGQWIGSTDDRSLLEHGLGLTDLVPSKAASSDRLLTSRDFDIPNFIEKVERYRPKIIAFNGEMAAAKIAKHLGHTPPAEGPIDWTLKHALLYRLPSSSSANATGGYALKRSKWDEFGCWVRERVG